MRVRLAIGTAPNALLVPQTAIGASQTGQSSILPREPERARAVQEQTAAAAAPATP
ncbi:MAG: hypothetical protein NVS2B5_30590 [Beijerinckiaceae bacterium]